MQKINYEGNRIETGPVQFGDDWPGYFMRGDEVMGQCDSLNSIIETLKTYDAPEWILLYFKRMAEKFGEAVI